MYAVKKGHVEVVKRLMKCTDLDVTIKNRVSLIQQSLGTHIRSIINKCFMCCCLCVAAGNL